MMKFSRFDGILCGGLLDFSLECLGTPMGVPRRCSKFLAHGPAWPAKGLPLYMFDMHFSLFQQQGPFFPVDINFHFYDLGFEFFPDFL